MEMRRRSQPRDGYDGEAGQVSMFRWDATFVSEVELEKNQGLVGRSISELAAQSGKHPVDMLLDLAVEEDLKTEFRMPGVVNCDEDAVAQIVKHPLTLVGASDGGAHTKFLTTGRYPTYFLSHWVRDKQVMSLEEAHWRLSTMIGWAIGIRDRGWLREGMPADIIIYDQAKLGIKPTERLNDLPDGDWRRVQKAEGYRYTLVNGEVTFEDNICTGALPGKVLRSCDIAG
jgi:N-acyl-D-aspartate/D-glutamate deacylase